MTNTDMVSWHANGHSSFQKDLWSTEQDTPHTNAKNNYVTSFEHLGNRVRFVSSRALETGEVNSFVIPVDQTIEMVYAFLPGSIELEDHHDNYGTFSLRLNSDGTVEIKRAFPVEWTYHAWAMWLAWSFISLVQIITNRYLRHWL